MVVAVAGAGSVAAAAVTGTNHTPFEQQRCLLLMLTSLGSRRVYFESRQLLSPNNTLSRTTDYRRQPSPTDRPGAYTSCAMIVAVTYKDRPVAQMRRFPPESGCGKPEDF